MLLGNPVFVGRAFVQRVHECFKTNTSSAPCCVSSRYASTDLGWSAIARRRFGWIAPHNCAPSWDTGFQEGSQG